MSDEITTTNQVLAGAGLLRYNNTLSVNPVQRLRSVTIREKLTVPEPNDPSDATSKSYVDTILTNNLIKAGHGLKLDDDLTISLRNNQTFKTVKLTEPPALNEHVVTKGYVDNFIQSLPTKTDVAAAVDGLIKRSDVEHMVEPMSTRAYVESFMELLPSREELTKTTENLVSREDLKDAIVNLANISYVDGVVADFAKKSDISQAVSSLASKSYVDTVTMDAVSKSYLNEKLSNLISSEDVDKKLSTAVASFAEKIYVDEAVKNATNKDYVDESVKDLVTKSYVQSLITSLAKETFVEEKVANLATKSYVDEKSVDILSQIKTYVDTMKDTNISPVQLSIQHVTPSENDTIPYEGKHVLLLNAKSMLEKLTVEMPKSPRNGQVVKIATTRDVNKLHLEGFDTVGDVIDPDVITLTAGSSATVVYSEEAKGWFSL